MQNFFIRQNSTLPVLAMEIVQDGFFNPNKDFLDELQNAVITFTMVDKSNCKTIIKCNEAKLYQDKNCNGNYCDNYFIVYEWNEKDTKRKGEYDAFFEINFIGTQKKLKVPIKKQLKIIIF